MNFSDFLPTSDPKSISTDQENIHLIENNTRSQLFHSLNQSHNNRLRIYSYVFNFVVLFCLLVGGGCTLYFCRKQKLTPYEQYQRNMKDQQYILSKIRQYQEYKFKGGLTNPE